MKKRNYTRIEKIIQNIKFNEDRIRLIEDLINKRKSKPNQYNFIYNCLQLFPDNIWPETELADKIEELALGYVNQLKKDNKTLRKKVEPYSKSFEEFKRVELEILDLKEKIKRSEDIIRYKKSSAVDVFMALEENGLEDSAMSYIRSSLKELVETNKKLIDQKYKKLEEI